MAGSKGKAARAGSWRSNRDFVLPGAALRNPLFGLLPQVLFFMLGLVLRSLFMVLRIFFEMRARRHGGSCQETQNREKN
jgi:hypothetical protein